jgi:hypothetical protein
MPIRIIRFLNDFAAPENYEVFDSLYGRIELHQMPSILQSSGAVYGIWVESESPPSLHVEEVPGCSGWYPVYWGKDISPVSRMKAHVQGHKNGNIDLQNVAEVQGKPLMFGAILVARYREFESLLHTRFPPLRGSCATGKEARVISVQN